MLKSQRQRRGLKINVDNDNGKNISDSVTCVILWFIKCTFYSLSFVWRHHPPSPQPNFLKLWIELFNSFHVPVSSRLPRRTSHQSSYWNSPPNWNRLMSHWLEFDCSSGGGWVGPPYNLLATTTFPENWVKPQLSGSLSCLKIFQFSLKKRKPL